MFLNVFFDLKINFFHFTQKKSDKYVPLKSSKHYSETLKLKNFSKF